MRTICGIILVTVVLIIFLEGAWDLFMAVAFQ